MARTDLSKQSSYLGKLTDKQRMFCHEYLIDYNASRAAKAAKYACPSTAGAKLLKDTRIQRYLGAQQRKNLEQLDLTREDLIRELSYQVFRDVADLCDEDGYLDVSDIAKLPARIRRTIDSLEVDQRLDEEGNVVGQKVKLKLTPKLAAIELAMKHFGMLQPDINLVQQNNQLIQVNWDELATEESDETDPIEKIIEGE